MSVVYTGRRHKEKGLWHMLTMILPRNLRCMFKDMKLIKNQHTTIKFVQSYCKGIHVDLYDQEAKTLK